MSETLLQVENLRTYFHTFRGVVKAVDGISFSLDEGQVLGIVGESGSGKSVSSFSILKLIETGFFSRARTSAKRASGK